MIAYQFQVDGRAAAPIREKWRVAAQDAVSAGYASWTRQGISIKLDYTQGAKVPDETNRQMRGSEVWPI